jgi:HEAT repeat protein
MAAADSLGRIGDHRAVDPLIQFLPPENQNASISIAPSCGRALAEIGDPRAVEPLIQALKCASKKDWRYYADALGITGDPRAIKSLAQALLRGDIEIRRHASRLLGEKFGESAVPYLVRVLSHEDYTARILAAEALKKIDSPAARDALARSHNGKEILEPVKDTVIIIKAPKRKWWEFWKL